MSYGRYPYYIWSDGSLLHFYNLGQMQGFAWVKDSAAVDEDAINQFLASLAARGDKEINERIARGLELRPELGKVRVTVHEPEAAENETPG